MQIFLPSERIAAAWRGTHQPPGELGVAAGHERSRFLMARLNEADGVLALAQRLHDAVDAVARKTEHRIHAPVEQAFHQAVGRGLADISTCSK
jgi:hypothetical protein